MSLASTLLAGGALGAFHAFETDHIAAVATLVDEDTDRPGLVGVSWGVGHTLPIAAIGIAFVVLGLQLPAVVTHLFEIGVAVVLLALGLRLLLTALGDTDRFSHDHGDGEAHSHFQLGEWSLGLTHGHTREESFTVGILHGVAGSGVIFVVPAIATRALEPALVFLAGFGLLSVCTMGLISFVWGVTLSRARLLQLKTLAGVGGIGVGLALFGEVVFGVPTPL